jgi:hypothetical protein
VTVNGLALGLNVLSLLILVADHNWLAAMWCFVSLLYCAERYNRSRA